MKIEIKHRWSGKLLFEFEADTSERKLALRMAIEAGAKSRAYLGGAYLRGADLRGAYLGGADLGGANLGGAYLGGADLGDAKINWESHDTVAAILVKAAGDNIERRMVAGLILVSLDLCWGEFVAIEHDEKDWALDVLSEYVRDGDNAPNVLRGRASEPVAAEQG